MNLLYYPSLKKRRIKQTQAETFGASDVQGTAPHQLLSVSLPYIWHISTLYLLRYISVFTSKDESGDLWKSYKDSVAYNRKMFCLF